MRHRNMKLRITLCMLLSGLLLLSNANAQKLLIPMDLRQTDHLKAYGLAFTILEQGYGVEWLLNYRGGSFLADATESFQREARLRNVRYESVSNVEVDAIYADIEESNADRIKLEKAPRIAVYTPPNKQPWDDAVTLALIYAEIPYETLWDKEVLTGKLPDYDWVHLHHEDFTGQYGKFYRSHGRELWYRQQQRAFEQMARDLGFSKVSTQKGAVVQAFAGYVREGGFLFAMCSATDTFDIALASWGLDIADTVYDGDPINPGADRRLDFGQTFAFENFGLVTDPMEYEYSTIDVSPTDERGLKGADVEAFTLFEFSAKYDPVPTMLTQNHVPIVRGFLGQTTAFRRSQIKPSVTILGEVTGSESVKYIHGNVGRGTFTFYAGHDPEDYRHLVGDPPTQIALHKNSPGYRLILNNILFPAAKKQKRKT